MTMRSKSLFNFFASLTLLAVAACTKGLGSDVVKEPDSAVAEEVVERALVFTVTRDETKAGLGDTGAMTWESSDVVRFYNGTTAIDVQPTEIQGSTAKFVVSDKTFIISSGKYYAAFPASMVEGFEAGGVVKFKAYSGGIQSKATSFRAVASCDYDKTLLSFKNVSYVFRVTNPSSSGIVPTKYSFIALDGTAVSAPLTVTMSNDDISAISRNTSSDSSVVSVVAPIEDGVAYLNVDPFVAAEGWAVVASGDTEVLGIRVVDKQKTFTKGYFRNLEFIPDPVPPRPDPVPSINGIEFSSGNLYYDASLMENGGSGWGIEARQYDFRTWGGSPCCINGVYSTTSASDSTQSHENTKNIGLFFWNKSADNARARVYSTNNETYSTTVSDNKIFADNLTNVSGLPAAKSGYGTWHVMTKDEVNSLVGTTDTTSRSKFRARATINVGTQPITGVVLLPDVFASNTGVYQYFEFDDATGIWTFPSGYRFKSVKTRLTHGGYGDNTLSENQWALLEYIGAVFLPAVGSCGAQHIYKGGTFHELYYWTGSYYGLRNSTYKSYYVYGKELQTSGSYDADEVIGACQQAFAIRLVRTVPAVQTTN